MNSLTTNDHRDLTKHPFDFLSASFGKKEEHAYFWVGWKAGIDKADAATWSDFSDKADFSLKSMRYGCRQLGSSTFPYRFHLGFCLLDC
ncbi:MAG: hypothetical protein NTY15_11765 [Planctomycetota bacterium]|nr:hypothetical protein [Planctomycetota bacterium]